jgi:hypothetical protein
LFCFAPILKSIAVSHFLKSISLTYSSNDVIPVRSGFWSNDDAEATRQDSRWGILDDKKIYDTILMILKIEKKRKAKQNATLNNRLKNTQNTSFEEYVSEIDLRKWETAIDLRIGRWFEDWTSIRDWTLIWVLHIYMTIANLI